METRRTDPSERRKGVWRLYDPRRRCYSVRLWFSRSRAEQVARRWAWGVFETEPHTIIHDDTDL